MKYIYLTVIIFLLTSCSYGAEYTLYTSDYIPNNSIRFIRTDIDTSILINKDEVYYLLLLNKQNIDMDVDYLIKYKDIKTDIEASEEYVLNQHTSLVETQAKDR